MTNNIAELLPRAPHESPEEAGLRWAIVSAATSSAPLVYASQIGARAIGYLPDKPGGVVSQEDIKTEEELKRSLRGMYPHVPIIGEETGMIEGSDARYCFLADPIDGSRPHQTGVPTSTIISGVYDNERSQLIAATVVEPATGRVWHADGARTVRFQIDRSTGSPTDEDMELQQVHVWPHAVNNPTVLVENPQGYKLADGRQMLTGKDCVRLFKRLQKHASIENTGSNGAHHAYIANGNRLAAGSITTSVGGVWDLCGALLVKNAGGLVQGLRLNEDRSLEVVEGLNPFVCDMLLTANRLDTLEFMHDALAKALRRKRRWFKKRQNVPR